MAKSKSMPTVNGKFKDTERRIKANDFAFNSKFNYANNYIKTSKYTLLTFLPLNLFEQFQRLANFYFLCLMVLQMISVISSLTPITTSIPLIGVLSLTAIKDAYDDYQRHISDNQVNRRKSKSVRNGKVVDVMWSEVHVGDIILMEDGQFVAADVLLLSTSEPNGLCFIETAELDGETNLKCKQCLPDIAALQHDVTAFDGEILCETPNNLLNKFSGVLYWRGNQYILDNDRIMLRGCILRNTQWCYGVVIFAGQDTKLMQNSGKTKFKRTTVDRLLNFIIIGIVLFLLSMCLFASVACGLWEYQIGRKFQIYLPWESIIPPDAFLGSVTIAILVFFSYAIVLNTLVPISLYVSVEVIRFMQSFLINWDKEMYCRQRKMYAKSRTTTLNEELGQIQYIFSDKTGTLTQNIMTFNRCSINGIVYGDTDEKLFDLRSSYKEPDLKPVDFSWNTEYEPSFVWFDSKLVEATRDVQDPTVHMFFRLLALCHTVMPNSRTDKLIYQAQSPDEAALVSASRNFGIVFKERSPNSITIEVMGKKEVYQLLCILDFNNTRKRMSVILQRNDELKLFCKGADNVIYERLKEGDEHLKFKTLEHLNQFAGDGLRTLCLAVRDLDEAFFLSWKKRHLEAAASLEHREEKLDALYNEIEKDMTLLGVTAIEDKLQDGVPHTIANLLMAGINIWMLTGDKQETAINVGYACQLLNDDMEVLIVDGHTQEQVDKQLRRCLDIISGSVHSTENDKRYGDNLHTVNVLTISEPDDKIEDIDDETTFSLVINGHSLVHALHVDLEKSFLEVCSNCKAVICCRVTPLQKALVIELVKNHKKAVTLAIGDGANDVSMIKAAHIGVGISGEEGNQAMLASDYSIAQFRFLQRLLLVHGRWSYLRMSKFLRYFFYKNFVFTLCHFWFAFFCGFSAQTVFDPMYISVYNLFYTSLPVLAIGILDQDVNDRNSIIFPRLYTPGLQNLLFNKREFLRSALMGFFASAILFLIPYGVFIYGASSKGFVLSDYVIMSNIVSTILVVAVTIQVMIETAYWTIINHIVIWGSFVVYFFMTWLYTKFIGGKYAGALNNAMTQPVFYLTLVLVVIILIVPVLGWRFYFVDMRPTLSDRVRLKQRLERLRKRESQDIMRTPSARHKRRSIRSGYAFAHQEGFGRLITSGKMSVYRHTHDNSTDHANHVTQNHVADDDDDDEVSQNATDI
ncbi:phospholipid-transporting ATPase ID isoform X2 [Planococcus citri]|uniref:phospholipid-transporting ATPase ID isoform X2 n=1 Tax=Planococcus citri TaxID=170843 RepID=UPI0031F987B8